MPLAPVARQRPLVDSNENARELQSFSPNDKLTEARERQCACPQGALCDGGAAGFVISDGSPQRRRAFVAHTKASRIPGAVRPGDRH
jgi:hypothetical protein